MAGELVSGMHAARTGAVVKVIDGLLRGGKLVLTHLGRSLKSDAFAKHNSKWVDRLLGNCHLHRERLDVHRAIAAWVIGATERPVMVVDWSNCQDRSRFVMLTAAVPLGGRTVTLYEEVHPLATYNSPHTHRNVSPPAKPGASGGLPPRHCCPRGIPRPMVS